MRGDGVADCKQMNAIAIIAYELLRELDLVTQMEHLLQLCMLIPLSAASGAPHYSLYTVPRRYSRMIFGAI